MTDELDQKTVVSDCLVQLGLGEIAKKITIAMGWADFQGCIDLAQREAKKKRDQDVLDRLYFANLIYDC